jgi:hypothetical protein
MIGSPTKWRKRFALFTALCLLLPCLVAFEWPDESSSGEGTTPSLNDLDNGSPTERVEILEAYKATPTISSEQLAEVRETLFSSVSEIRQAAAAVLGTHGLEADRRLLIRLLHDDDEQVQLAAIEALRGFGSRATVVALANSLSSEHRDVRIAAARALGTLRQSEATFPLLDLLLSYDRQSELAALAALGELGDPRAIPGLAVRLQQQEGEVAMTAAESLAKIDTVASVAPVLRRMAPIGHTSMASPALGRALRFASSDVVVEAIMELGGFSVGRQLITRATISPPVIRGFYRKIRETMTVEEIDMEVTIAAIIAGVRAADIDRRRLVEDNLGRLVFVSDRQQSTGDAWCARDEPVNAPQNGRRDNDEYRMQVLVAIRAVEVLCEPERMDAKVRALSPETGLALAGQLEPSDPVRTWLLGSGINWDASSTTASNVWDYVSLIAEEPAIDLAPTSHEFGLNAVTPALAYAWRTPAEADVSQLLSEPVRLKVCEAWIESRSEGSSRCLASERLLPPASALERLATCSSSSSAADASSTSRSQLWRREWSELEVSLCGDLSSASQSSQASDTSLVDAGGFAPGADHRALAESIWHRAVKGELSDAELSSCIRYSLGDAAMVVRQACFLAAQQADSLTDSSRRLLNGLTDLQMQSIRNDEEDIHRIAVTDTETGLGIWGAPVLLFLSNGSVRETVVGPFGFLAVPAEYVSGVAPI